MNHVITVIWGDLYEEEYAQNLEDQLRKHTTVDFEFHCFRIWAPGDEENEELLDSKNFIASKELVEWMETSEFFIQTRDPRHSSYGDMRDAGGLSHFRKILMMKDNFGLQGKCVYLDLDTQINDNVDWLFELDDKKPWAVKNYWFQGERFRKNFPRHRSPMINSSVLVWNNDQLKPIYEFVDKNLNKVMFTYNAIDNFMNDQFCGFHNGKANFFNFFPEGKITNKTESTEEEVSESSIVTFSGLAQWEKDELCLS